MQPKDVAIRKRSQILKANRTMFLWVSAVSAVVGVALVGSIFLIQKIAFNEKILAEKNKTISILEKNNKNVPELEAQVRVLDSNKVLIDSKAKSDDQAVQVILDALPPNANSLALGASLQDKLLSGISGLTINSLQVDTVVGVESLSSDSTVVSVSSSTSISSQPQITFRFAVKGSETALKEVLTRLERSIRTIDITLLRIESQGSDRLMTIQARAFYEPARSVELRDKVVKP